jgi:hypothetical protein
MSDHETRAEILVVGTVEEDRVVSGWVFDGHGKGVAIHVTDVAVSGVLLAGYTVEELAAIAEAERA